MNKNKNLGKSSSKDKNRRRKILLGMLIPCSIILVGAVCGLGIYYGCPKQLTFKNTKHVDKYINSHKKIHKQSFNWSDSATNSQMLSWLWNRKNYGLQNIINSFLVWSKMIWTVDVNAKSSATITRHSFKINYELQQNNIKQNQNITIKDFTDKGFYFVVTAANGNNTYYVNYWDRCETSDNIQTRLSLHINDNNSGLNTQIPGPLPAEYPNIIWPHT